MRSIELNGMQKFIMPRMSPSVSSKLISTTTSFGGTICTNCGLLSTRSTDSVRSNTFTQAACNCSRNRFVIRETSRNSISVSGRRASGPGSRPPPSNRSMNRIQNRRIDVEDQVAFKRLGPKQIEAGRVFQAEDELAVSELIDAGELHFDDAAEQAGQGRAEIAAKTFVQRLQGAHLLLADALGPFEIVGRDFFARPAGGSHRRLCRALHRAACFAAASTSMALSRLSTSA